MWSELWNVSENRCVKLEECGGRGRGRRAGETNRRRKERKEVGVRLCVRVERWEGRKIIFVRVCVCVCVCVCMCVCVYGEGGGCLRVNQIHHVIGGVCISGWDLVLSRGFRGWSGREN